MKTLLALFLALALSACALPTTRVNAGTTRPTLTVIGAPANAVLYVDGLQIGTASQFNGAPNTLLIEEGVHRLELRDGATVLMVQKILASGGENTNFTYNPEATK
ncbi:MAG: hypothetical protein V4484_16550 [Pseudomonadota bacterium]